MSVPAPSDKSPDQDYDLLLHTLSQHGVMVRFEACDSDGGLVRLRDEYILLLNPRPGKTAQKAVMIAALRQLGSGGGFKSPRLRQLLGEKEWG